MGLRTFTFAGTASSTYDLFITEAAPYNAPPRSVEMIEVPGRNGAYALDNGYFENIEVTYRVCVSKSNHTNFQSEITSVRNWLCSKVGYQRLTDDYNPNEYRMAIYKSGLESDDVFWNGAEFDITFECKPQRFLTSGETATTVANNGTLTNPTNFEAEPLLAVKGYGDVSFNGYTINLQTTDLGDIVLLSPATSVTSEIFDGNLLNNGDVITIQNATHTMSYTPNDTIEEYSMFPTVNYTKSNADCKFAMPYVSFNSSRNKLTVRIEIIGITATYGTWGELMATATVPCKVNGSWTNYTFGFQVQVIGSNINLSDQLNGGNMNGGVYGNIGEVDAYSTKSALGNPTYIDCEIGECYKLVNGEIVTLNHLINLGSDLPKLSTGTNTFTMDNTITELKVTPNWWQV